MTSTPYLSPNSKAQNRNIEKMTSTPYLSPNSKAPNSNIITPSSISDNFSSIQALLSEKRLLEDVDNNKNKKNNHGAIISDEITEMEYLQRKIAIQKLEMKRMQTKTSELEDASILSLDRSEDTSLTVVQRKSIYVEQTEYFLQISKLEARMEVQKQMIEKMVKAKGSAFF